MSSAPGQLAGLDIDALFSSIARPVADHANNRDVSGHGTVPACPAENAPIPDDRDSRTASNGAGFGDVVPPVPVVPLQNGGIGGNTADDALGLGCAEGSFRAENDGGIVARPALHYRLHDERNGAGSIIGTTDDTPGELLHELVRRYGPRLDIASVREAFEERAAIMQHDGGMSLGDAERAALADVARVFGLY